MEVIQPTARSHGMEAQGSSQCSQTPVTWPQSRNISTQRISLRKVSILSFQQRFLTGILFALLVSLSWFKSRTVISSSVH